MSIPCQLRSPPKSSRQAVRQTSLLALNLVPFLRSCASSRSPPSEIPRISLAGPPRRCQYPSRKSFVQASDLETSPVKIHEVILSIRTKLTLVSLPPMMLPYRINFVVTVLIVASTISAAIDLAKENFGLDAGVL